MWLWGRGIKGTKSLFRWSIFRRWKEMTKITSQYWAGGPSWNSTEGMHALIVFHTCLWLDVEHAGRICHNTVLGHYQLGHVPPGHLSQEHIPPRHLPPGHLPPQHLPPRTLTPWDIYPLDTYLQDTYPLGHIPPGTYTPGQIPPEQIRLAQTFETERKKLLSTLL